jgi:8-oxo-dGTP diphosphatase
MGSDRQAVDVAVGVLIRPDGHFLLTSRPAGKVYAGYWEFPGGKLEPGESATEALARECREELGLEIEVGARIGRGSALHGGRRIVLEVFLARRRSGELRLHEHEEHGWFAAGELERLDWPDADLPILPKLARVLGGPAT